VFCLAFLSQFRPRGGGWFPAFDLAVTAPATVMCWYVFVALIVAIGRFRTTRVSRIIDAAVGTVLISLGILIATTGVAALAATLAVQVVMVRGSSTAAATRRR
jgi:threonine/homoserine/homoserine lactone efflux protein